MKVCPKVVLALAVLLELVRPIGCPAQLSFTTNNGAITITGYTGSITNLVIPSTANGYAVASIGDGAFFNGQQIYFRLASVTIPDSVTNIGNSAFLGCSGLTNVSLGAGVVAIGTKPCIQNSKS